MSRIDLGNNIRNPKTVPATAEGFYQKTDAVTTKRICAELADVHEAELRGELTKDEYRTKKAALKLGLPYYTPHAHFAKGYKSCEGEPVDSGKAVIDMDGCDHFPELYEQYLKGRERELGINMVNRSASGTGGHVLFDMPDGLSREQAQAWMAHVLGDVDYDKAVHERERAVYIPCRDYILYIDEELMFGDELHPATIELKISDVKVNGNLGRIPDGNTHAPVKHFPQDFKGIPYADIIREYWRRTGGEPSEGERNKRLHQLAANLRAVCDNSEEWLLEMMPRYGLSQQEMQSIVHSACKEPTRGSRLMDKIIEDEKLKMESEDMDAVAVAEETGVKVNVKSLPIGLRESLIGVPASMHMPVLCSVMPLAAAYADQVEMEYCDGEIQRMGMMAIVYGEQASGKSVCKRAINIWKRQFDEEDALARSREEEWTERKKGRKANEKIPENPKVLIRVVPVTISCSTLLKRLKYAKGHTLFSFCEELDTLRKTNGAGSWSSKYDIYRMAFDCKDSEWGQDYNSDQAESGVVKVAYNWTMLGTNGAVRKCFKGDNIENGLSSRILLAEMPDSAFARMPRYGRRSAEDEARIQEAVTRLRAVSGFVDTPRLRRVIDQWVEEKRVEAAKNIDHVKDTYRRRAAVIGFRCGVIFHLLTGNQKESKACLDFAVMMADYCLQQQIKVFGEALQNQFVDAQSECQRYGANLSIFDQLPSTFTADDLAALKRGSMARNSIIKIISRWKRDNWIEKVDSKRWTKTKSDSDKVTS